MLIGIAYNIITQKEESADVGVIHNIVKVLSDTLSFEVGNHAQMAAQALKQMQVTLILRLGTCLHCISDKWLRIDFNFDTNDEKVVCS